VEKDEQDSGATFQDHRCPFSRGAFLWGVGHFFVIVPAICAVFYAIVYSYVIYRKKGVRRQ